MSPTSRSELYELAAGHFRLLVFAGISTNLRPVSGDSLPRQNPHSPHGPLHPRNSSVKYQIHKMATQPDNNGQATGDFHNDILLEYIARGRPQRATPLGQQDYLGTKPQIALIKRKIH